MLSSPRASIIIVNYNGRRLLEPCLTPTVEQARDVGAEVILVDNASSDGSVELVRASFPDVIVVENPTNEGFAGGCNAGVRHAHAPIIVLLNNDAVPEEGWLEKLLRELEAPDVAVACSVVQDAHFAEDYALGTGSMSVIGHPIPNVAADPTEPFYATGCSLAFKRDLFEEPFHPVYFAYYEDTLLSWRARLRGFRVVRALGSRVQHLGSATASQQPTRMLYYWERNKLLTLLLCYEPGTLARLLPLYAFDSLARLARDFWLLIKRPTDIASRAAQTARRYGIVVRAIVWILTHPATVARLRWSVQRERRQDDRAITPYLSGKIFDDVATTRAQGFANRVSLLYCRLAGIATAESVALNGAGQRG